MAPHVPALAAAMLPVALFDREVRAEIRAPQFRQAEYSSVDETGDAQKRHHKDVYKGPIRNPKQTLDRPCFLYLQCTPPALQDLELINSQKSSRFEARN